MFLRKVHRYRGLFAAFGVACFTSTMTILVTLAHGSADSSHLVFTRGLVSSVFSVALLLGLDVRLMPTSRKEFKGLMFQGISCYVVVLTLYYAYQNMPTGDAAAIFYGYIAFSVIFGRIFLKEPLGWFEGIMVIITLAGVILIIRPPFLFRSQSTENTTRLLPALAALCSCLCNACLAVAVRALGRQDTSPIKATLYCALFQVVLSSALITVTGSWSLPCSVGQRLLIVAFGFLAFIALLAFTYALSTENIAVVTVITVSEVYMVFCAETFLLGRKPNLLSIIGMAMIVSSSLAISGKKVMQIRKEFYQETNDIIKDVTKCDKDAVNCKDTKENNFGEKNCLESFKENEVYILRESSV